jgi:predicted transcriptional regulator
MHSDIGQIIGELEAYILYLASDEVLRCLEFFPSVYFIIFFLSHRQYIKYPENPNTNVKEKIQELAKEKERQREQRLAFKEQLQSLNAAAERSRRYVDDQPIEQQEGLSWWRKAGRWIVGKNDSE